MVRTALFVLGVWVAASVVITPLLGRSLRIVRAPKVAPSTPNEAPDAAVDPPSASSACASS